jgi:peptide/nickel transport system substrate-binding protein
MEPVDRGGWSVFCNAADMLNLQNPGVNNYVRGWVGGYKNEIVNRLIDHWLAASDPSDSRNIFEQIQRLSFDDVPMIPLGQFQLQTAYSRTLTGVVPASNPQFWNVRRV